jgi:primosomal protein N' (replication factor Y)
MSERTVGGRAPARKPASKRARTPATELPVAKVAVDLPLLHLDRPFDYLVDDKDSAAAQPGTRVRVRFAGQKVDGFVLQRVAASDHIGTLSFLDAVVSAEPVLTPEVFALARSVADHYVGTVADVLRLAVPPRHARTESEAVAADPDDRPASGPVDSDSPAAWSPVVGGAAFVERLGQGQAVRAVCTVPPGSAWPALVAEAVVAARGAGHGALIIVPDHHDAARAAEAIKHVLPGEPVVHLAADAGPAERYRRFLAVLRGSAQVVVGSRAAVFAPVRDLGLVVVYDDGDDLHAEPRAPYPHVREVAAMRAHEQATSLLLLGHVRTAEGERLVRSGWAVGLTADRAHVRELAPEVHAVGDEFEDARDAAARSARLPSLALRALREGLEHGPVLVQVPRAGYVPALRCQECRHRAECSTCNGPLRLSLQGGAPTCSWCGVAQAGWRCSECGSHRLRAARTGARRTAEELGRAFPGKPVVTSGRDGVLATVPDRPAVVVATPGAEPVADHGYSAVVLLDGDLMLDRPDLRAAEEAVRRWSNAIALCRSRPDGGRVVLVADGTMPPVQAIVRADPEGFASREFDERARAHMPPAARIATLTGEPLAVAAFVTELELPSGAEVLGPLPVALGSFAAGPPATGDPLAATPVEHVRTVVRVPLAQGAALAGALRAVAALRSARKELAFVSVRIDPLALD